jgi:glycosyltransferase involved in cell wall biosynthesis
MKSMAKEILVFSDWFDPAFKAGGPIRSLLNLTKVWPYQASVITSNEDLDDKGPMPQLVSDQWVVKSDHLKVYYQSKKQIGVVGLKSILEESEWGAYYINSLFSLWFSIIPLWMLKLKGKSHLVVLAPRGMLHEGALNQKYWKKKVFMTLGKMLGLWKGIQWHATSEWERKRIFDVMGPNSKVIIFPNVPLVEPRKHYPVWSQQKQRWLTVSRISPEKGILEGLLWLATSAFADRVELLIIGPVENKVYHQKCLEVLKRYPKLQVLFLGELPMEEIQSYRAQCHLYYSTTKGENFGHSIAEAILAQMPVLISNTTPWQHLRKEGIGWDVDWNESALHSAMNEWWQQDESDYEKRIKLLSKFGQHWLSKLGDELKWNEMFPFL